MIQFLLEMLVGGVAGVTTVGAYEFRFFNLISHKDESIKYLLSEGKVKNRKNSDILFINLIIFFTASFLFLPFLGSVHLFDWDEANFAESAREMIESGDYFTVQINFQTFWEKPPLFIWLQVLSMHLLGINELAARIPNAVTSIITLLVLFNIGRQEFDKRFGLLWVLAYAGSILPHFYFKSGIIDPVFNLFIFLGLYQFIKLSQTGNETERLRKALLAGVFIGLAVLTKGPVAYLIISLCILVYFLFNKARRIFYFKELLIFTAVVGLLSFAWFGVGLIKDGPFFLISFIEYQIKLFSTEESGHGGPIYYHFIALLLGCFPASIYIFKSFKREHSDTYRQKDIKIWMTISFLVVLILFTIVKTKIVHYSSFCYFPITFLAAYALHKAYNYKTYFSRFFYLWFITIGGLISIVIIFVPLFLKYKEQILPQFGKYIDVMLIEAINAPVVWAGWEILIGCFYFISLVIATIYHYKNPLLGACILFVATIITIQFTLYVIVPKIEEHVQGGLMRFYKSFKDEDVYLEPVGFRSYAYYFYSDRQKGYNSKASNHDWLMSGDIDKPAYLIRKINRSQHMDNIPELKKIGSSNGYVFYKREVPSSK